MMKASICAIATAAAILMVTGAAAQDRPRNDQNRQEHTQFDAHDQQVTQDWYKEHQAHPPIGFRSKDKLSSEEEGRLREGAVLDQNMRRKVHPAPVDLTRRLPPPARDHRYVAIGGHVALLNNKNNSVTAVIHLHDNH
jgi:Ni/Co efflux regulator RcnB